MGTVDWSQFTPLDPDPAQQPAVPAKVDWSQFTPLTGQDANSVARPDEPGILSELGAKFHAGLVAGKRFVENAVDDVTGGEPIADETARGLGYQDAADYARHQRAQRMAQSVRQEQGVDRTSASTEEGMRAMAEADKQGVGPALMSIFEHPRAAAMISAKSLGMAAPGMAASTAAGAAMPLVVGLNSAVTDYQSTLEDQLTQAGVDLSDPTQVRHALENPALMQQTRQFADKHAIPVTMMDVLTAGLAGRLVAAARTPAQAVRAVAGETSAQMAGGALGEAGGELNSEGRISSPTNVAMEAVGEAPTEITEARAGYREALRNVERAQANLGDRRASSAISLDQVHSDYQDLADSYGATVTSRTRTPEHNREVGGVPNSQHLTGTAWDFVVPAEQKAAFKADARRRGYQVIDEGDHIHLELPGHHPASSANVGEPDRLGRIEPTLTPTTDPEELARRVRERRKRLQQQDQTSAGDATAQAAIETARQNRGMPPDDATHTSQRAIDEPTSAAPSAATGSLTAGLDALREQLLNQLTQHATEPAPAPPPVHTPVAPPPAINPAATVDFAPIAELAPPPPAGSAPQAQQIAPQAPPAPSPAPTPSAGAPTPVALPAPAATGPQASPVATPASAPPSTAPSPPPPSAGPAPITQQSALVPERHPYDYNPANARSTTRSEVLRSAVNANRRLLDVMNSDLETGRPARVGQLLQHEVREVVLPAHQQSELNRLGRLLGRRIVPVQIDAPGHLAIDGMVMDDHHIFVNVAAARANNSSIPALIGHEFLHTLRKAGNRDLDALIAFAKSRINTKNAYVRDMDRAYRVMYADHVKAGIYGDSFTEELIADMSGDLMADPAFWEELAQYDPSLFRRTIKRFIEFLRDIAARAKRLGDDGAFRQIEEVRGRLKQILADHVGRVHETRMQTQAMQDERGIKAHVDSSKIASAADEQLANEYFSRRKLREGVASDQARAALEAGEYQQAASKIQPYVEDHAAPMPADTPEKRAFLAESSLKVNPNRSTEGKVHFHGTARDITEFRPKQGEAVFMAQRAGFTPAFAAASAHHIDNFEGQDIFVGGKSMREARDQNPVGSPEWMLADLLMAAKARLKAGGFGSAPSILPEAAKQMLADGDYMLEMPDGTIEAPTSYEKDALMERIDQIAASLDKKPSFLRYGARHQTGMNTMPLVTNASKPFDFEDKADVKRLVKELQAAYGSATAMSQNMVMRHGFKTWDDVTETLRSRETNWTLLEDEGLGIPALLREMGYDSYYVSEQGFKNLAVFDPRKIKSATANVGPFGMRAPTAEEAAQLGMTLEEAKAAQAAGDIRLSLNRVLAQTFTNPLQATGEAAQQVQRWLTDEYQDLKTIQRDIAASQFGGSLPQGYDAHRNENLRHGAFQDAAKRAEQRFIAPIARILSKAGTNIDEFSDYLWWRHAPERDAYLRRKLDPSVQVAPDGLAGISPQDAQAAIAALDPAKRAAFERAAKFIDGMRHFTLDTMLSAGLISQDYHDAVLQQYQHYVPLRGLPDGSEALNKGQGAGKGLSMSQRGLGPRAAGRKSKPDNIIEEMMRDMDSALVGVQKQRVLDSLVRLIVANPDPSLWEIQPVQAQRKWVNGVLTVVQTNGEPADQLTFMHHGLPVKIEIRHKGLREAMLNMQGQPLPGFLRQVGRLTRWLSAVKTAFSPYFMLINPVRDTAFAIMGMGAEHGMAAIREAARFYPHVWGALMRDDQNLKVAPQTDPVAQKTQQYAREFAALGGKTGRVYVADIREQQRKLHQLLDRFAKSKGLKDIAAGNFDSKDAALIGRKLWQRIAHTVDTANDMAENSTRLAVYCAMRERGLSAEDAAAYAKEVTVNFNRRGRLAHFVGPFYMFFNASVQGGARFVRLMGKRNFQLTMGAMFGTSYALALAQMVAAGDDDDGESRYDKAISDAQAQRYIGIYMGKGRSLNLPIPYGPNILTYMGYRMARMTYAMMRGREDGVGSVAGDIAAQAAMAMSPIDPGKGAGAFLPEAARIPYQIAVNRNDFGTPISPGLEDDRTDNPRYQQTSPQTPDIFRYMARVMSEWTGGNEYKGGAVNLSGEQARYASEQLTGGMGRLAGETWGLVDKVLSGVDPEPSDIPLANVYYRGKGSGQHANTYYNNLDDYTQTVADWKHAAEIGDQRKLEELYKHAPWVEGAETDARTQEGAAAQAGTVMDAERAINREMKKLRREKNKIAADPALSHAERKRALAAIDDQIAGLQQDFNYAINSGRGYLRPQGPE